MKASGGQGRGAWKGMRKGYVRWGRGGRRCGWRRVVEWLHIAGDVVGWKVERWSNTRCGEWRCGARDVELESGPRGMESGVVALRSLESGPGATRGPSIPPMSDVTSKVCDVLGKENPTLLGEATGFDSAVYTVIEAGISSDSEVLATPLNWTTLTPVSSTPTGGIATGSSGAGNGRGSCDLERMLLKKEHAAKRARLDEEYLIKKNALEQEYFSKEIEVMKKYVN
ncbi:hypothetical protein Pcinc_014575 [Petrolisthes cinctipes]|uniref:Uncharacterized protein n=1 Tax=Petrolisthes cinctipes TaxID=88211 RepID=A0AAE1FWJ0_PETCI|nr:hypothetical protein Pcinc_014575 [Petrolisthes cinctipes]